MHQNDTIVALATPPGESAIGMLRLSGDLCYKLCRSVFDIPSPRPRHAYFRPYRTLDGERIDEVLLTYFEKDHSYTGDAVLEISCHGNPYILKRILDDLLDRGCRQAEPGEFTRTAFLNGKMDLSQAEAVIDVIHARSELALKAASQQLRGSLSRKVEEMVDLLLQIIAEVEAYIDFPEEDLPTEDESAPVVRLQNLIGIIDDLRATSQTGMFLREGVKTIIIGEPNVGKSSLLNYLLGESRVIVSDTPGTTRDFVEASFMVGSYRIRILDTAGVHPTDDPLEQAGIHKTHEQLQDSDLVLWTVDASKEAPSLPKVIEEHMNGGNTLIVLNKSDLGTHQRWHSTPPPYPQVAVSALKQQGRPQLTEKLKDMLGQPDISAKGDFIAVSSRHMKALNQAREALEAAIPMLDGIEPAELAANHLRDCLDHFGAIVGRVDNERMLDKLFASFCIGK